MRERVRNHKEICKELSNTYEEKNLRYGNSFESTFEEYGPTALLIRLDDKLNRAKTLISAPDLNPQDESLRDTLMDLANYAIMGVMALGPEEVEEEVTEEKAKPKKKEEKVLSPVEEALNALTRQELLKVGEDLEVSLPKRGAKGTLINRISKGAKEADILKALEEPKPEKVEVAKEK